MLHKTYQPNLIEKYWIKAWSDQSGSQTTDNKGESYCIMLPPPNITGSLHMGHGLQVSLMDALIRYHRMCGKIVHWQGGTDHAGIATQMVVERQLLAAGKTRAQLGRERFLAAIWDWKAEFGGRISQQLKRLGASIDAEQDRFTCDPGFAKAVSSVFIKLYESGLIFRGKRLVNWDPKLLTAISDLEVLYSEEAGSLYYLNYPLVSGKGHLLVATTRPETLFGDVAVAIHPEDMRYRELIGELLILPLTDRRIPIISDSSVDPQFGTGCVKITPAHDFNDYRIGQHHGLDLINIMTPHAKLNESVPKAYQGMDLETARKQVIKELSAQGLVEKIVPHTLKVPHGDRSGAVIEPYLTDQWFVRMKPLAEPAIAAIKQEQVRFVPDSWNAVALQWLENIEDWCISRQLWWGHRIPAWYDPQGNIFVGESESDVRKRYQIAEAVPLSQDEDVLDTWVSSALWPFVTLGWPEGGKKLAMFYPTAVLVTGFDIIFFWVARMLMLGLYFTGQVPFKTVYLTGLVKDQSGQKMSKSKGNGLDPLDIIDGIHQEELIKKRTQGLMQPQMERLIEARTRQEFPKGIESLGADALRFSYYALASPTRDIRFDLSRAIGYRNFCNKLWQAARFVLSHNQHEQIKGLLVLSIFDQWILAKLQITINQVHKHFSDYRFDLIAQTLYEFVWHDFCDWYLEFTKPILFNSPDIQIGNFNATRDTLMKVLETVLRLLHPLMPFITESLWQEVMALDSAKPKFLKDIAYPQAQELSLKSVEQVSWLQSVIGAIRGLRSELGISPAKQIALICCATVPTTLAKEYHAITQYQAFIKALARVSSINCLSLSQMATLDLKQSAVARVGTVEFRIPFADLMNKETEVKRLQKVQLQLEQAIAHQQNKLSHKQFLNKAPVVIVKDAQTKLKADQAKLAAISKQLALLKSQ